MVEFVILTLSVFDDRVGQVKILGCLLLGNAAAFSIYDCLYIPKDTRDFLKSDRWKYVESKLVLGDYLPVRTCLGRLVIYFFHARDDTMNCGQKKGPWKGSQAIQWYNTFLMNAHEQKLPFPLQIALGVLAVAFLAVAVFAFTVERKRAALETSLTEVGSVLSGTRAEKDARIATLEAELASTTELLRTTEEARESYQRRFEEKEEEVDELAGQVKKISGTVGILDKLAKTDPELLMKYSKVYFLSEHYTPEKLTKIAEKYSAVPTDQYLETRVYGELTDMIDDAKDDDVNITVRSAYRSFEAQKNLKSAYSVSYGTGANAFSADQGYSEHQLGTTVDLTSPENGNQLAGFDGTKAFAWLQKNAHKYGFILSYPGGNAYYIYEPWHWRYVGHDLAGDLKDDGKNFYDLDQREIDEYLVTVFD